MIKMISLNNFDNFDARVNTSADGNEDLAQEFTAIFNVFSPSQPEAKIILQNTANLSSDERKSYQNQSFNEFKTVFENKNADHNMPKADLKLENKLEFINQTEVSEKVISKLQNETILPESDFSIKINPAVIEKEKTDYANYTDIFSGELNLLQDRIPETNTEQIKGEIPVTNENLSGNIPVIKVENTSQTNSDFQFELQIPNLDTPDNFPEDVRILTQFSNKLPKFYGNFDRNQTTPRETGNIQKPKSVDQQSRTADEKIDFNPENILDLSEGNYSTETVETKAESPFQLPENAKVENIEILSLEISIKQNIEPLKSENSIISQANTINFQAKNEKISAGKILIEEDLNLFAEKTENKNFVEAKSEAADLEITEIKSAIENSDILELEADSDFQPEILEITPDNIETLDYENIEIPEPNLFQSPGNISKTEKIIPKTPNVSVISKTEDPFITFRETKPESELIKPEFEARMTEEITETKPEPTRADIKNTEIADTVNIEILPQLLTENFQSDYSNQTQEIKSESVPTKKLKYFYNLETNRVEEVRTEIITEKIDVSSKKEPVKDSTLSFDTKNQIQTTNIVKKLYTKVSDIFQNENAEVREPRQLKVLAAEEKNEKSSEHQVQEFWSESSLKNLVHTTNPVRNIKPREILTKDVFNESNNIAKNEIEISQNPQNINPTINSPENTFSANQISQSGQTISPVTNNAIDQAIPKPDKPFKFSNELSGSNFEKFLKTVSNEQETIEVKPKTLIKGSEVIEQIEPKIIELATIVEKSEEKHLLKMRLNPAELGEVEIKLEKDASGKINAHIRTENESARHILAESLGQLRDSLQNSGWQIEKLEVSYNPNQSSGNESRENQSRQNENADAGRNSAFGFGENVEMEGETPENPANRLVNLRA